MYGFVFAVTYILVFSALVVSIPADLQGQGGFATVPTPVDPALVANFTASTSYSESDFSAGAILDYYYYDLGVYTWEAQYTMTGHFQFDKHLLWYGIWLGAVDWCTLTSVYDGAEYTTFELTLTDIEADSQDGTASYDAVLEDSGNTAGRYIFWYNDTTYDNTTEAWDNDGLTIIHGLGFEETTGGENMMLLLLQVLFLQIPDVPTSLNALIVAPTWACIVYLIWFIIKESMPFV